MKQPAKGAQFKLRIDDGLKQRLEAIFVRQGVTSSTEGINRVLRTFVDAGEDLHPLMLDQVRGANRRDLAKAILRRMARGK
jgi:hypothetical protein